MPERGQRRTLALTLMPSMRARARRRRLVAAALTSASAFAGGGGPCRMARAVIKSSGVTSVLVGLGGGMTGAVGKVTGNDDAAASKCHAVARRKAAFGAALCA